ncbi:IS1380-Spn1 transposase [Streptococcus pneumoniae]|nr:IS1380-Spn1 transposase [Streptococcus pneumoniae]
MKILPFIARGTSYYLKMSVKKLVPFLVVGLMLAAGDSVYAYSRGNGSIARGDDYPAYYKNGSQEIDQWRMYSRQCTSFVAFRLSNVNGFEIPAAYGNANEWGHRARREGYRVDNTPTIGSITWSTAGTYGHVAWVSNVMGDQIEIEEYNYGYTESYNKRVIKANTMTGFIHFKDLDGGSVGNSQSSTSTGGTHYFKTKSAIKTEPLASGTVIDYYYPGEKVHYDQILEKDGYKWLSYTAYNPQLFTPNLKTIQNPCLSLDPGWFLFSPNGCFLLDKKEFPLYGISVEKNTKRKETHMNSLPNHHFQNKSFYQLSFDGGHLTQYGGLIFFQELFSQLKLKERISKYLVTNDQRRYCRYSDSDILVQFLFQLLTGYGTDYACKELSADAYFPKLLEGGQLASQPTLSRFLSRTDEETVHSLRCLNLELVEFFLQFHQLNQLIVDIDSTHFTTYGKQEGVAYNAHYRAHGYHPLYAFEGKTGYCFNAQLRPGNRYCSEEADSFITPVLERFNQLLFRMDSGFATPKLYDLIEKTGQYYLIKLKKNTVLSRLGDLSLPCPQDEDLTILPHSAYSETLYQAGSWSHKRRVCQFSERKEGNLFYDVISLVTNMTSGTSQDQFQLYRGRGQAENFIKEMKEGFFGDKTDSSTLIKNEVRMMMSCIAYNLYLFLKHLAGGDFQTLTIKRFRHLFLHVVGKCVRTGRKQLLKLSSLYAYSELFSALYSRIRKVNLNLPVPYEPPRRKASLMMH